MKRLGSSDSLGALVSICPNSTDESNPIYTREFQSVLDGLDEESGAGHMSEKKRRLTVDQVKALEKNFEVENKLEPERKVKLAQEIGLQPRQVAVWFQNRRARYKTKQLERDYGILKANYDNLKHNYDALHHGNQALLKEIRDMKSKLSGDGQIERKESVKEEEMASDDEDEEESKKLEFPAFPLAKCDEAAAELEFNHNPDEFNEAAADGMEGGSMFLDFKDGSSDSTDSSAILNEGNNSPLQLLEIQNCSFLQLPVAAASDHSKASVVNLGDAQKKYHHQQQQHVKIEEHNFFGEESCSSLFSDDQAPTLHWYCSDNWN